MAITVPAGRDPQGIANVVYTQINPATAESQQQILEALQSGFIIAENDGGYVEYPNDTTEVYTFTLAGTVVNTVTIVYTDSTKANLLSWSRT